jgi:ketosteroid isomerase-like protein
VMSEENVEIVRRSAEAFARGDRSTWLAFCDADTEVVPPPDWPDPAVRGAEAAWAFYIDFFDAFEEVATDPANIVDAGGDHVLLHSRFALSGKGSGAGVEFDYWGLLTVRQGKVRRACWFTERAEALEAAGRPG